MASREGEEHFSRIVSATRLHLPPDASEIPEATEQHLRNYVDNAHRLGVIAAIAVNVHETAVARIAEEVAPGFRLHVLPVPCWGAFVPALNALLNFAQRCGAKHILYQSLEVQCSAPVLQRLLDHHTDDTLVVGPVFNGHDFKSGERLLNGRTTPWNTLALWSVRKLALTGFLCIADGLPDVPPSIGREGAANPQEHLLNDSFGPMGGDDWWTRQMSNKTADSNSVPAGVEEVTAIALLQHLHGQDRARAVLLQLSAELEAQLSWSASWAKDERRAKWHKYKMESKVSRPAAQLEELFKFRRKSKSLPQLSNLGTPVSDTLTCVRRRTGSEGDEDTMQATGRKASAEESQGAANAGRDIDAQNFGVVMHYGESIVPTPQVKWISLASCWLFSMNSTAVLASAFRQINRSPGSTSWSAMAFTGLLIGGVYLPMPLSLWLTRRSTRRANHIAGLALFGGFLLLGHVCAILAQLLLLGPHVLLLARLVQGLGSGVLFQVRFVLASVSTSDQHALLQSWIFLVSDLGLGLGALLPVATASLPGLRGLRAAVPELLPSLVLAFISLVYIIWVLLAFPCRLPLLSDRVRFPCKLVIPEPSTAGAADKAKKDRLIALVSGTTRVFVQSAILPTVALSMRDANWTGNFRQTLAVAAICLLPMPFEAIGSRICCACSTRARVADGVEFSKLASGVVGAIALAVTSAAPRSVLGDEGDMAVLIQRICELAILMIVLAMAAPFNASRLYQLKDAEKAMVMLEWMKAYIGRLLGPFFAIVVYHWIGYGALLSVLCSATAVVTLTA